MMSVSFQFIIQIHDSAHDVSIFIKFVYLINRLGHLLLYAIAESTVEIVFSQSDLY